MKPSKHASPVGIFTRKDLAYLMGACVLAGMTLGLLIAPTINA